MSYIYLTSQKCSTIPENLDRLSDYASVWEEVQSKSEQLWEEKFYGMFLCTYMETLGLIQWHIQSFLNKGKVPWKESACTQVIMSALRVL